MSQSLVIGGPYEKPKTPFKIGELKTRVWRAPFTTGLTDVWRKRCNEYWERVEQRFGIVVSEPQHAWDDDPEIGPVVATYATILGILKGDRYDVPESERSKAESREHAN
jgi:hypothetical protein